MRTSTSTRASLLTSPHPLGFLGRVADGASHVRAAREQYDLVRARAERSWIVPSAASGGGAARLRRAGADAGQGRERATLWASRGSPGGRRGTTPRSVGRPW